MRAPLRILLVLAALAALLAVPTVASAYAPNPDEFVTCIQTNDVNIECVAELLESDCLTEVVATRAKEAVVAAAERQRDRADSRGPGNGNSPPANLEFHVPAKAGDGDIDVTIECGPRRVRGVLVASEAGGPLDLTGNRRGIALALASISALVMILGAVELMTNRRRSRG